MRLILVRHGDAYAGLTGTIAGPTGCAGLTDLGRQQAARLREHLERRRRLRPDVLLSSELPRAIETATIIAPALGFERPQQDCNLCEVHVGVADGLDWSEWERRFGPLDMPNEPERIFAPGGDSWTGFHERVHATMLRLARQHEHESVVAVCHAGVITATLRTILGIPDPGTGARLLPTNTGLTEWHHDPVQRRWTLVGFNDVAHLHEPDPPA